MLVDELIAENMDWATGIVKSYSIPKLSAEDVSQEALVALIKAAQSFDVTRNIPFRGYAHTVIINRLNSLYAHGIKRGNEATLLDIPDPDSGETARDQIMASDLSADQEVYRIELREALNKGIEDLTSNQRAILEAFSRGESFEEISQRIGVSRQAVRQSMERAIKHLRPRLESRGICAVQMMPAALPVQERQSLESLRHGSFFVHAENKTTQKRRHFIIAFVVFLIALLLGFLVYFCGM